MNFSCKNKKIKFLLNWIFWVPLLFIDLLPGDYGYEYGGQATIILMMGIFLPIFIGFLLSIWLGIAIYFLFGLVGHWELKRSWGAGFL